MQLFCEKVAFSGKPFALIFTLLKDLSLSYIFIYLHLAVFTLLVDYHTGMGLLLARMKVT